MDMIGEMFEEKKNCGCRTIISITYDPIQTKKEVRIIASSYVAR